MSGELVDSRGGVRPGAGRKPGTPNSPSWFRVELQELLQDLSPKIREFVTDVFNNAQIEPRVTKDGVIFTHASVHDKTLLLSTLAKLAGFTDADNPLREPLQRVIDKVQAIELLQEINYGKRPVSPRYAAAPTTGAANGSQGNGHTPELGNGKPSTYSEGAPA